MRRLRFLLAGFVLAGLATAAAPPGEPWFIDDEAFNKEFSARLTKLARNNETLKPGEIKARLKAGRCALTLPKPDDRALTPEQVYARARESVFVVGSVMRSEKDKKKWDDGRQATAWAITADGVLLTNWHVLASTGKERFGVANSRGDVFPITDILAGDPDADIAVIRVKGKDFVPLPLGPDEPVGAWVGVMSHPGGQLFSFTQGFVTRFLRETVDGRTAEWMAISADYAAGSSGAPVLNRFGAVVGMASMTLTIESEEEDAPAPKARRRRQEIPPMPKAEPPAAEPKHAPGKLKPQVQMVTKLAVPARVIRALVTAPPAK